MKEVPKNVSESVRRLNPHLYDGAPTHAVWNNDGQVEPRPEQKRIRQSEKPLLNKKSPEERLNKTERRWLEELHRRGFVDIKIQAVHLQLGFDCRYTPDFFNGHSRIFYEVKGFKRDDAMVKLRVAARTHSWASFVLVQWQKGQWIETEIQP